MKGNVYLKSDFGSTEKDSTYIINMILPLLASIWILLSS
jgi:hypothetical protein